MVKRSAAGALVYSAWLRRLATPHALGMKPDQREPTPCARTTFTRQSPKPLYSAGPLVGWFMSRVRTFTRQTGAAAPRGSGKRRRRG